MNNRNISRRNFLKIASGLASFTALNAHGSDLLGDLEVREIPISVRELPSEFQGFRIGFITDLHLGPWVPIELVESAISALRRSHIDIMLIGGDLIGIPNGFPERFIPYSVNREFEQFSRQDLPGAIFTRAADILGSHSPPSGRCAVLGNHDQWIDPDACGRALARNKIPLLVNKTFEVKRGASRLVILGVDDYWTGIPSFNLPAKKGSREVRVLLAHNPDYVASLVQSSKAQYDLALCGHTHGGQVILPLLGAPTYNIQRRDLGEGLHSFGPGQVFTSRGIGVVELPFRLNCPPEVTILSLVNG